jgi:hypothetical protein
MSSRWESTSDERKALFAELGLCLYLYQKIEVHLKLLLPHMVHPKATTRGETSNNWRELLDSKQTLGPLIRLLVERVEAGNQAVLEQSWRTLVEERNEVVHHFAEQPFAKCDTEASYQEALAFLRLRRQHAMAMLEPLQQLAAGLSNALKCQP